MREVVEGEERPINDIFVTTLVKSAANISHAGGGRDGEFVFQQLGVDGWNEVSSLNRRDRNSIVVQARRRGLDVVKMFVVVFVGEGGK